MNKFKFFTIGLLVLLLGIQFRLIDNILLTPKMNKRVAKIVKPDEVKTIEGAKQVVPGVDIPRNPIKPPDWFGWIMITIGSVSFFHSLMLPKDG